MDIIISVGLDDCYKNYKVISNFKDVYALGNIDNLIINDYGNMQEFDACVIVSNLYSSGTVKKFYYINDKPSKVMSAAIRGVKGIIYTDVFYFDDEDELSALLEDSSELTENSLVLASTQTIKNFIMSFTRHEKIIDSPVYLESVTQAINELSKVTLNQECRINEMGSAAIDVFERASSIIETIDRQKAILEQQLKEFEEIQTSRQSENQSSRFSTMTFFPTFKYTGSAKVLSVREFSPCRYLTSFLLSYVHYLSYDANKTVKLIVAHQKGKGVADKYPNFTSINLESEDTDELYKGSLVATNNPKKAVMQRLTHQDVDVIIVLDRLYGSAGIVNGKVTQVNAVSGKTDLKRYGITASKTIFPITEHQGSLFTIPLIKNYPTEPDLRNISYATTCMSQFKVLDSLILN